MLAADAWLTPIGEVFQFLEDAMTVKISFAMATGQVRRVKVLLIVGVLGGLATGVFAATLLTVMSFIEPLIRALLVPYSVAGTGCSLIPTAKEIVLDSRSYWLLNAWSFPFNFITLVLTGFILGSLEFGLYGAAMLLSQLVQAGIWFGLKPADGASPGLSLMGWANLLSSVTFVVVCFAGILWHPTLRQRYKLSFSQEEEDDSESTDQEPLLDVITSIGKEAAGQGGLAMTLDLSMQANYTAGIYMSGLLGVDQLYQVSALQAAMPMFGTAYAIGLSYSTKLRGGMLVALGKFNEFSDYMKFSTLIAIYFAVVTVATTLPFREWLAFYFASPACVYASEVSCLPTYSGIFGGGQASTSTLQDAFVVFSFAAAGICLFTALKAGLYCCFDFKFLAVCGVSAVLLFVPCAAIAFRFRTAAAMYTAMYLPTILIGIAFAARLFHNRAKMLSGESGPWAEGREAALPPTMATHEYRSSTLAGDQG